MKGKIIIDKELCKGCGYCITACPQGLIALDKGFNPAGYLPAVATDNDICNGCGLCAIICPDIAIEVWKEENKKSRFDKLTVPSKVEGKIRN